MKLLDELDLNSPVVNGTVVNWDNVERIWHHVYYRELRSASGERSVLLANSSTASLDEKIKYSEIFYEALNAPALCIQSQSVLAMYGSGLTDGICMDMGYDTTDVVPAFEGGLHKFAHIENGQIDSSPYMFIIPQKIMVKLGWLGRAVFAALEDAKKMCIEKEQYEEYGSR